MSLQFSLILVRFELNCEKETPRKTKQSVLVREGLLYYALHVSMLLLPSLCDIMYSTNSFQLSVNGDVIYCIDG